MAEQTPTIGRIVHYRYARGTQAAIIVGTADGSGCGGANDTPRYCQPPTAEDRVHLTVFVPGGDFPEWDVPYSEDDAPGTWCWPPRV